MKYKVGNFIKKIMRADISKFYILVVILISLFMIGGYFSYALFTVTKEKNNAISIVTGNLVYDLKVDGTTSNTLTIPAKSAKEFTITLSNPNNRTARFNFYYVGSLNSKVTVGYRDESGVDIPPEATGINLEASGSSNSSNTYKIRATNGSTSSKTITLGVGIGLDYNDLTLPSNGHLFDKYTILLSEIVTKNLSSGSTYNDRTDTFITGADPNNYVWYSGKLWRVVLVNNSAKTAKLVTQWNISAIAHSRSSSAFKSSYVEDWLNDTSVDGFLGNLRDYEDFIVTSTKWDATATTTALGSITRPKGTTTATDAVGLLNIYEYQTSYRGSTYSNGYLNNGLTWWTLTPYNSTNVRYINLNGAASYDSSSENSSGVRPAVVMKSNVAVVDGTGTESDPYRLEGDYDTNLSGTLLNTRYSGEYIRFATGTNNLYRIVSHETSGLTKITSAGPLKDSSTFKTSAFGSGVKYSSTNTIGKFLNGTFLTSYVGSTYSNMISNNTTWYLGTSGIGQSYRLAKYTTATGTTLTSSKTTAKVGLLRLGELMAGQFERYAKKGGSTESGLTTTYWELTLYTSSRVRNAFEAGYASYASASSKYGIKPALNLKSNVKITSGDGTESSPFVLSMD